MTIGVLLPVTSHDVEAQAPAGGQTTTFAATDVQKGARDLATKPFVPPKNDLPKALQEMTYDQYRDIRFQRERALWASEGLSFTVDLLHRGFIFKTL